MRRGWGAGCTMWRPAESHGGVVQEMVQIRCFVCVMQPPEGLPPGTRGQRCRAWCQEVHQGTDCAVCTRP